VKTRPFLTREALLWLSLFAPAITVLIGDFRGASFNRSIACMFSTWTCTIVCGVCLHAVVNVVAPRLLARASLLVAIAGICAAGALTVTISMLVLMPRLVWLDPNLAGSPIRFVLQALVVGLAYVVVARLVTWQRDRARASAEREKESEARTLRARLAALQAQLNPHFLFNTLNAIASLIPSEPTSAEATLERLASVLQYSIASSSRGRVTLAEEIAVVRDYLEIEQARFGERLRATIDVDRALESHAIPPMLLQPLVENAVLHGLSGRESGGAVMVRGRIDDDVIVLEVSDDGVGPGHSKRRGNNTGLANLRERLALTYGSAARLSVGARAGGGFECEIRMPRAAAA
jgi:signal transduction histidine kinase